MLQPVELELNERHYIRAHVHIKKTKSIYHIVQYTLETLSFFLIFLARTFPDKVE